MSRSVSENFNICINLHIPIFNKEIKTNSEKISTGKMNFNQRENKLSIILKWL
jgi:hypothetical protein